MKLSVLTDFRDKDREDNVKLSVNTIVEIGLLGIQTKDDQSSCGAMVLTYRSRHRLIQAKKRFSH